MKMWFDDNKHILGTVGMCILIMQVGVLESTNMMVVEPNNYFKCVCLLAFRLGG